MLACLYSPLQRSTCLPNLVAHRRRFKHKYMSDSSYSDDERAGSNLEYLFEGSDSDDDVASPAPAPQEEEDDHLAVADLISTTPENAEPAPAEDAAREPDGHANPDGIL